MDHKVVLAVAGSGKTRLIVERLSLDQRALVLTYTRNNERNLRKRIIDRFGFFPDNIQLSTYLPFLYSFVFRPFLLLSTKAKGLSFDRPPMTYPNSTARLGMTDPRYFFDGQRVYANRVWRLVQYCGHDKKVLERINKYFDLVLIDEVQDFAAHDFNFISSLSTLDTKSLLVGDFYQHTYKTSSDGNTNSTLHSDYTKYVSRLEKCGFFVDKNSLHSSYRCLPEVCDFITESIGINIESARKGSAKIHILEDQGLIDEQMRRVDAIKLFYSNHANYSCVSQNWGKSKGDDHYEDVCVALSPDYLELLREGRLREMKPMARNRLYVACSRANRNLYFLPQDRLTEYKIPR